VTFKEALIDHITNSTTDMMVRHVKVSYSLEDVTRIVADVAHDSYLAGARREREQNGDCSYGQFSSRKER
jgi:hypothetical protein